MRETGSHSAGRRATDEGLTIVELIIALVLVMIAFAVLASTLLSSFAALRSNEARVQATALGNELIEEMSTIPWPLLGLYEHEAPDTEFEGEFVVLIPEPDDPADRNDIVPRPVTQVDRDGRQYTVERWVTVDDVEVHLKRMIAIITWEEGGREHRIRTEGVRSPDPDDLLNLQVRFEEFVNTRTDEAKVPLKPPGDPDEFTNADEIRAVVRVGIVEATVVLRFVDRTGAERTLTAPSTPADDEHLRVFTIAPNEHTFPHGNVDFTVVATGDDEVASQTDVMRFYQPLDVQQVEFTQENNADDEQIEVCEGTSALAGDVTLRVEVWGMTPAEAIAGELEVDWGRVPSDPAESFQPEGGEPLQMQETGTTDDGGIFETVVESGTDVGSETNNAFRVSAHRMVGDFDENDEYIEHDLDYEDEATTGRLGDGLREVTCVAP